MERIGVFGGSFDPPHIGHIQAANSAVRTLGLDRLLLIPAATAPHKTGCVVSGQHRMQMMRLACRDIPNGQVSDLEIAREGISYTADTVAALRAAHPQAQLYLLVGSDMFLSIHNWRNAQSIYEEVTLAVLYRGERDEQAKVLAQKRALEEIGCRVVLIENEALELSSTQMRRLLAFRCAGELLPEGVLEYIREHRLYDTRTDRRCLSMEQLEPVVIGLLKPNRVKHVLGCRDTAVELARRWGADETDAARAGILHDITKAIDGPLQLTLCREYGTILSDFSRRYPKTLHALTGSLVAERIFGENEAVVSAIASHTTGKAAMNTLEKIIYVADYMEPNRDFPGVERLRHLAFTDLDAALKCGLEMTLEHLKKQGAEVSPESREALEYLQVKI